MTRAELLASLTATTAPGGWAGDSGYADWSTTTDGCTILEVGDHDGEAVQLQLTRRELEELHQALTLTLLADPR